MNSKTRPPIQWNLKARLRRVPGFLKRPILAAVGIAGVDAVLLVAALGSSWKPTLVLVLFLEGGVGLLMGTGIALSSSPSVSKVGETVLGTAAWSREAEKNAERVGLRWILGSSLLVLIGFGVSML